MQDAIKQKIIQIVQTFDQERVIDESGWNENLMNVGITSIEFIRLMVAVEEAFGIEFPDEALDIAKYPTLKAIGELVGQFSK